MVGVLVIGFLELLLAVLALILECVAAVAMLIVAVRVWRWFRAIWTRPWWCLRCGKTTPRPYLVRDDVWCIDCVDQLPKDQRIWRGTRFNGEPVNLVTRKVKVR